LLLDSEPFVTMPAVTLGATSFAVAYAVSACVCFPVAYFLRGRRLAKLMTANQNADEERLALAPQAAEQDELGLTGPIFDESLAKVEEAKEKQQLDDGVIRTESNGWEKLTGVGEEDPVEVLARCFPPSAASTRPILCDPSEERGDSVGAAPIDDEHVGQQDARNWVRQGTTARQWVRKPTPEDEQVMAAAPKKLLKKAKSRSRASGGSKSGGAATTKDEEEFVDALRQLDTALEGLKATPRKATTKSNASRATSNSRLAKANVKRPKKSSGSSSGDKSTSAEKLTCSGSRDKGTSSRRTEDTIPPREEVTVAISAVGS